MTKLNQLYSPESIDAAIQVVIAKRKTYSKDMANGANRACSYNIWTFVLCGLADLKAELGKLE